MVREITKKNTTSNIMATTTEVSKGAMQGKNIEQTYSNIKNLNVARGGKNNFGFVAEDLVAQDLNRKFIEQGSEKIAKVIDNNGIADIIVESNGKVVETIQVKFYGDNTPINVAKYKDQTIYVQKNVSQKVVSKMEAQGVKVVKSNVTKEEALQISKARAEEVEKLKNLKVANKNIEIKNGEKAHITTTYYKGKDILKASHKSGVKAAGKAAAFGGGMSLGGNLVDLARGDKDLGETVADIAVDTVVASATGYGVAAVGTAVAGTTIGTAILGTATAAGTAVAGTTVGGAVVASGATIATIGSTAAATISGATATAIGSMAAATAVGAATIAAAPLVLAGIAIGALGRLIFGSNDSSDSGGNLLSLDTEEMLCVEVDTKDADILLEEFFKKINKETERRTKYYEWLS